MALFGPSDAVITALTQQLTRLVAVGQADTANDVTRAKLLVEIQKQNHEDQAALRKLITEAVNATTTNVHTALEFVGAMRRELLEVIGQQREALGHHGAAILHHSDALDANTLQIHRLNTILSELVVVLKSAQEPTAQPRIDFHIGPIREQ